MNKNLSKVHQKVQNVDFCDTDCLYALEFGVPLTAMPLDLRDKDIRVRNIKRVGETVDINDNVLERTRPRHLLENTQKGRHQTNARIFIYLSHDVDLLGLQAVIPFA